jgi:hypothetical protein
MSGKPPVPCFTDDEVIHSLRQAARRGLTHTRQGEADLLKYGCDIQDVCELVADCTVGELNKHELSQNYPDYNDYIAVLKIDLEGEKDPFYVKVALSLPDLKCGELMSFHPWGLQR